MSERPGDFAGLGTQFAYYTECQLATLEKLRMTSRVAKAELRRQEVIAGGMVATCRGYAIPIKKSNMRLYELLGENVPDDSHSSPGETLRSNDE